VDLPYAPRVGQRELVAAITRAQQGGHAVLEAATGTGKTVAALAASLTTIARDGRRVLYLTRTNAQQDQVVREHAVLAASATAGNTGLGTSTPADARLGTSTPADARLGTSTPADAGLGTSTPADAGLGTSTPADAGLGTSTPADAGLLVPFMGRRQYCPLMNDDDRFRDGTPEELGKLCRDAKRKATIAVQTGEPVQGACPYYAGLLRDGVAPVEALLRTGGLAPRHLAARIAGCGSCPYEALKLLLAKADVVAVPYVFLLDDALRQALLHWLGVGLDEVHVLIDEAHNLPAAAQEHHSPRLSTVTVRRALREAEEFHDPVLAGEMLSTSLLHALLGVLHDLAAEHIRDRPDARLPPGAIMEALMARLAAPSPRITRAFQDLGAWGDVVREARRAQARLPRSHMGAVAAFLHAWNSLGDEARVQLVLAGDEPAIETFLLDPAQVLGWLHEAASTVHMSGTLAPPEEHRDRCGLPADTSMAILPSAIAPDRLRVIGVEGVHRRWSEHQQEPRHALDQQAAATAVLAALAGKTALLFPSHAMLAAYHEAGFLASLGRRTYIETAGMSNDELTRVVAAFRLNPDARALLVGVVSGRLAEGLDFPGDDLRNMLVFGIPYPPPSARLDAQIDAAERRHPGRGWTYTIHNVVARRLRQAAGRLVRGPDDHGVVVVLDERIARFRTHLPQLVMVRDAAGVAAARRGAGHSAQGAADLLPGFQAASTLESPAGRT
jgi:DNA excision repair protein ERCC-2